MSSSFGSALRIHIFGQSHGPAIGVCIDGFPVGFSPDLEALQAFLLRRAPGQRSYHSARQEPDVPEFLSGLHEGHTCGAPITAIIRNRDAHSADYAALADIPRPSHADYPARVKYDAQADWRGGGHFSGRLTAPLCIAGGLCLQWLSRQGIRIGAHIAQIGSIHDIVFDPLAPTLPLTGNTLDATVWPAMLHEIDAARAVGDSVGGCIECAAVGLPAGCGEPMFDGLENRLAQILFGIPGVRGVEFGSGFSCAAMRGSQHNDSYCVSEDGTVSTRSNHAGGILGGISTGMPILFRVAMKPTPSIALPQESIRLADGNTPVTLSLHGRHDPCIVPRALPCVEAAAAIAIMDAILEGRKWI